MNGQQIRACVAAIPAGDRQLLLDNIQLITQSQLDAQSQMEQLEGIISFVDPLAMGEGGFF